ncbi:CHAP domain-containing protein [Lactonifactor sp. BIOML-A3]|uniref:CHAP domain-containing protein n=1 Tax=unclassified Lactonifactor TaxID=2636670 RepID=UPI0012AFF5FE|nr:MULTISPECIES: CHAP domain-containing protein [unclassified Lactonifactor]MSA02010.1 CHAP domain-containing protein [Lactonifactor sp. BIOML-A5]MSA08524.1 CHAP domain-containing protein [Lactonifactor sp. BIOML-A4]MSA12907.1 CHAP domain-containing protein [Lactonifactor sp. BIOML-A3]MSA17591.1 CHAP domain-containing protein [Lactonifactor sp. BIOML-A2]MSA37123.1 CHAP domain-containing protein [Lactonifactor sp. BIOML-A1]
MSKGIKTKTTIKDVKALDKGAVAAERMKQAFIRTKDKAEHGLYAEENSPGEYAADRVSYGVDSATHEAVHQFDKQGRKGVQTTKENLSKVKENIQKRKFAAEQPKKQAEKRAAQQTGQSAGHWNGRQAADTVSEPVKAAHQERSTIKTLDRGQKGIKTVDRSRKTIKQTSSTAKGAVKTTSKSIKTAETTAKASIKTSQQAAKAAQQTAVATARAARAAAHAARAAAIATAHAIKVAAHATAAAVKAIIAATKALIAAIAAGGWIAVVVVIVICLIGMILGSCFGIFFSGEDSGTGQTMQTAVQEINTDYQDRLDEIKASHSYDVLEMSGSRAVWKEVLAVYAVKTTTDPDAAQEVATMDDTKKQLLKDIFWEMNEISSSTETQSETVIETSDDGNGNIVETETTITRTYLYITVSHKTAEEMADHFGFNEDQREQMAELLADENNPLWSQVLYGISGGDGEIVTVALSQVGNVGGEPYWSWYGFSSRVEWCACFVSWCANECGYIEAGVIPKFAACASQGVPWFQERGLWQDNSYEPRPGDIIFFDWDDGGQDGSSDHVGIVEKVENGRVYTIEGNSGDSCRQNSYPVGYYEIYGYGTPAY